VGRERGRISAERLFLFSPDIDAGRDPAEVGRGVILGQILAARTRKGLVESISVREGLAIGVEVDRFHGGG
jgi:hypothetical protein